MRHIRAAQDRTGQMRFAVVLCCVIVASLSPFFWFSKVIDTQPAAVRIGSPSAVVTFVRSPSAEVLKNCMFSIVSSFVRLVSACSVVENSQDLIAKKRAPTMSSLNAMFFDVLLSSLIACQTLSGRHAW